MAEVACRTRDGRASVLEVDDAETIGDVKRRLAARECLPEGMLRLTFQPEEEREPDDDDDDDPEADPDRGSEEKVADVEPLLAPNPRRYTVFPVEHPDLYAMYEAQLEMDWTIGSLELTKDMDDWNSLTDNQRYYILHVLAYFAASDGMVMENVSGNFADEVQYTEARLFYAAQNAIEAVHSVTYSMLIDTYVKDPEEKARLFNAIENYPSIKRKADWAKRWMDRENASFAERLVAFVCVEGIFFSGSFAAIYWLADRGLMPGLCQSNKYIARDEGLHVDFACRLYTAHIVHKLPLSRIEEIVRSAVDIECEFVSESLPVNLLGMNAAKMTEHVRSVADDLMASLGHGALYGAKTSFDFVKKLGMPRKGNFFEGRVSEYKKTSKAKGDDKDDFALD